MRRRDPGVEGRASARARGVVGAGRAPGRGEGEGRAPGGGEGGALHRPFTTVYGVDFSGAKLAGRFAWL
ncbi:MAG TPA: hypothetical protein VFS00_03195, partial [Polyangiaceae bacterium]|nr:hypothetical protein [Polyangiaceae bacterium]